MLHKIKYMKKKYEKDPNVLPASHGSSQTADLNTPAQTTYSLRERFKQKKIMVWNTHLIHPKV